MNSIELHSSSTLHANAVVIDRIGLLVIGAAKSGKSSLCDQLVGESSSVPSYSRWIADDQVKLTVTSNRLLAQPAPSIEGKAEIHHLGIVRTSIQSAAVIDFVVELLPERQIDRMPELSHVSIFCSQSVNTIKLPRLAVPEKSANIARRLIHHFICENVS